MALVMELGLRPLLGLKLRKLNSPTTSDPTPFKANHDIYKRGISTEIYPCIPESLLLGINHLLADPSIYPVPQDPYILSGLFNALDAEATPHL